MKGNVHKAIVSAAANMLPPEVQEFLKSKEANDAKTRLDYILEGTVDEDSEKDKNPYLSADPRKELPMISINTPLGDIRLPDYMPHLEHFWNTQLEVGRKGLLVFGFGPFRTVFDRATEYWGKHVLENYRNHKFEQAWNCLGRVLHLLVDVGVPAHVHGDPHLAILGFIDDDDYEDYTGEQVKNDCLPNKWNNIEGMIVYNQQWELNNYFRELGEISRLYDSDDRDGLGEGRPYRWERGLTGLISGSGDITGDLTDMACNAIARDLVPVTIRFVAGLFCHFFKSLSEENVLFNFPLHDLEVTVKSMHIYDCADPSGTGEIFMTAFLD